MPRGESIWVSGTVFERTPQGIRPIAGAAVHLADVGPLEDANDPRFSSNTLTDAAGRYLLCPPIPGTGTDTYAMVSVQREGYQPSGRAALLGWDYDGFDIELRSRALGLTQRYQLGVSVASRPGFSNNAGSISGAANW
jgi:hypothetical protein